MAATALAALGECNQSYAPYSASPAGLALRGSDGAVHAGGVIESCAYNPSMSPMHTALVRVTSVSLCLYLPRDTAVPAAAGLPQLLASPC